MRINAHAKINLGLDITGKREDGYHLVRMVMQQLELHDSLEIERTESAGIFLTTGNEELPADPSNLIWKAAELFLQTYMPQGGVRITLEKRIPLAAGLAGGSADAAATLRGLNRVFGKGLSEEELRDLGVRLGADVPFCLLGGAALAEGIGEILTPLPSLPDCGVLLVKLPVSVSTAEAYRAFDAETKILHPDIDGQVRAMQSGDKKGVLTRLGNVLEPVTARRYPEITELCRLLEACGAEGARMSGSGPTVYGIFPDKETADKVCSVVHERVPSAEVLLTEPARKGGESE